ncbi:MAG: filamentous hemagglutinin N-terminal domain-containing protein [Leptolyngbyaceae cyanobacterium bins.349]|nr:filamentous hemagglutinin N-terminal domain-containing protein [Leptolyngbyaceae cyanobacterium bins.349]
MKARLYRSLRSLIFLAVLATLGIKAAYGQPITPAMDTPTAISSPANNPNQFDIIGGTRAGSNLFHSFQQFGLSQGQIANFLSYPSIQNILGRIVGGNVSGIDGLIQVTGGTSNLFLMNPAGIIFGPNARLNVPASFVATTASGIRIGDRWFNAIGSNDYSALTGTPTAFAFLSNSPGAILNAGNLRVPSGQSVTLLGGTVINTGTIEAPGGTITIAAIPGKSAVSISQAGSLLSLELPLQQAGEVNSPAVTPLSLPALLTGGGIPEAKELRVENGVVMLTGNSMPVSTTPGAATVSGTLLTTSTLPQSPGQIQVLGDRVAILNANLDASGFNGGGTVLIGGGNPSQELTLRAQATHVDPTSQIGANALTQGNGGQIVIWADGTTQVQGRLTANGGSQGGNGGLIETSGRQQVDVTGARVEAGAAQGLPGTWLIDPADITVATTGGTITPLQIETALNFGTNVSLSTTLGTGGNGDITLMNAIQQMGSGTASLTLTGRRFANPDNATISMTSTGDLTFNLNQVNPEVDAPSSSIQSAINAIGTVNGNRIINLGPGTYSGETITIDRTLNLNSSGASNTILSGNNAYRVLNITSGSTVNLDRLTIANGKVVGDVNLPDAFGGGIFNDGGNLTITNSTLSGNSASGAGYGIGYGGGIYTNGGTVTLNNSTLSGNSAQGGDSYGDGSGSSNGGGIYTNGGTVTLNNSTLSNNSAQGGTFYGSGYGFGGGIYSSGGTVTLNNSTLSGNSAQGGDSYGGGYGISYGGGIYNRDGILTLNNSTLSDNSAQGGTFYGSGSGSSNGGGIYTNGGTVTLNNSTLSNNSAQGGTFYGSGSGGGNGGGISSFFGTVTLNNSTLSGNSAQGYGGGIYSFFGTLTLNNSTLSGNSAQGYGGGIFTYRGTLTLNNSTLSGNSASLSGGSSYYSFAAGGGIYSILGTVTLNNSTLSGNSAQGGTFYGSGSGDGSGGGIYSSYGTVTLNSSTLSGNSAQGSAFYGSGSGDGSGGGIYTNGGTVTLNNSTLSGNSAQTLSGSGYSFGGGIFNDGSNLTIANSTITGNSARAGFLGGEAGGGGIYTHGGTLTLNNSTIAANSAIGASIPIIGYGPASGGGIYASGGTLTLNNSMLNSNQASSGGGIYTSGSTLSIFNSTVSSNVSLTSSGGGIDTSGGTLNIFNSTLSSNRANTSGGGISFSGGTLTLNNSTLSGNSAQGRSSSSSGGGISTRGGTLTLNNSTLSGNSAGSGGGIATFGGTLILNNSTLSGNSAQGRFGSGDGYGGGIYNRGSLTITVSGGVPSFYPIDGTLILNNSTLSSNSASLSGSGIYNSGPSLSNGGMGNLTIWNSLIAGNQATTRQEVANKAIAISKGYNLFGYSGSSGVEGLTLNATDIVPEVSLDRILAPLGNYGGPTQTHALVPGSPAINRGDPNFRTADQRGFARVGRADIGAFEFQGISLPESSPPTIQLPRFSAADLSRITAALYDDEPGLMPLTVMLEPKPPELLLCIVHSQDGSWHPLDEYHGLPDCPGQ